MMNDMENRKDTKGKNSAKEMKKTKSTGQRIEQIALAECAPASYQRATGDRQVAKIVRNFDESKLGALTVSHRDGKYYLVDGLHRSKALKALGYTHAMCVVLSGLTYEQEAGFFRRQNKNKRIITTFDDFKAGLEEKDAECVAINAIVRECGFRIGKGASFYNIASIRALFIIAREYGYEELRDTLDLLTQTWNGIPRASHRECLLGVAEFLRRYGKVDFPARMRNKFAAVYNNYATSMRIPGSFTPLTPRQKFCRILVEHYNSGLSCRSRIRLRWEN